ncbi:unnamed protein product [Heterobilharzia americana]|nr:unnamed protein product [Heterobilharzia americana]
MLSSVFRYKILMALLWLDQFGKANGILHNLLRIFVCLSLFCLCVTVHPLDAMRNSRNFPLIDETANSEDSWSLNMRNRNKGAERLNELIRYFNHLLRQQYASEDNEELLDSRKLAALSNQNKRDYLFLRG